MRGGAGVALVAVGVILLWMAITGKLDCLSAFVSCVFGTPQQATTTASNTTGQKNDLTSQVVQNLPGIIDFGKGLFGGSGGATPPKTPSISV
jgi:hypothetical protein